MTNNLWDRLSKAKKKLDPVEPEYAIVFEADDSPTCNILHPDPNWMACALEGGILPPISAYVLGLDIHSETVGPMTQEQAIEYLLMKNVPREVWDTPQAGNRRRFAIVPRSSIPSDRTFRNAWILSQE